MKSNEINNLSKLAKKAGKHKLKEASHSLKKQPSKAELQKDYMYDGTRIEES